MKSALAASVLVFAAYAAPAGEPGVEAVTIDGEGGWKLSAFYAPPTGAAGQETKCPAVILTHMLNRSKDDWKPLVPKLTAAGFAVVAYDMRGHGGSVGPDGKAAAWEKFTPEDWQAAEKDVLKVRDWLLSARKDSVDPARLTLAGASIGANLSLRALAGDRALRGAVLLSPGLDYRGVKTEQAAARLTRGQMLGLVASKGDREGASAETVAKLVKAAAASDVVLQKIVDGAEHGTAMFGKVAGIEDEIVTALKKMSEPQEKTDVKDALDRVL